MTISTCFLILTNRCDSRCRACSYWQQKTKYYLDLSVIEEIYYHFANQGGNTIFLTGGEPTLHPDFIEIARLANEYGFITILCTNGNRINSLFNQVKDYIDSYSISFDGDTARLYKSIRGVDFYPKILRFIDMVKDYDDRIQVWLSCMIQKKNHDRLSKILYKVSTLRANGIYFVVPEIRGGCFGREEELKDKVKEELLLTKDDIFVFKEEIEQMFKLDAQLAIPKLIQSKQLLYDYITYFKSFYEENLLMPRVCGVPYNSVVITEKEFLKPCFYLPPEYKFNPGQNPFNSQNLKEFWNDFSVNPIYKNDLCKRCFQFKG
ncbi:hypothetical protein BBF96_08015 [Anoxybacter fermentans]|uniref:Radical SAM core domain-containing protein n=1 Tax=Anoxybacter fermentans TaxID=1323375 RepID=A0A3Q9HQZ1_9FIRM|nr:radical SAM protein [Anoxybacter fermentans]AZR73332.1 hypothetical protein BBF96_08015 [Anoxybacter fermentans]